VNVARSQEEADAQTILAEGGEAPTAAAFFESEEAARDAEEDLSDTEEDGTASTEIDTSESSGEAGSA